MLSDTLYRYINHEFAHDAQKGRFRFGRLVEYQIMEIIDGDTSRGDKRDGRAETIVSTMITSDTLSDPKVQRIADQLRVKIRGKNSSVIFNELKVSYTFDGYVLCLSTRPPGNPPPIGEDCDTCIIVNNPVAFFEAICNLGIEEKTGAPVRELIAGKKCGNVMYDYKEPNFPETDIAQVDPFRKRAIYEGQAEARLVLQHKPGLTDGFIFINCPEAAAYISIAKFGEPKNRAAPSDQRISAEECDAKLALIDDEIRQLSRELDDAFYEENENPSQEELRQFLHARDNLVETRFRTKIVELLCKRRTHHPCYRIDRKIVGGRSGRELLGAWADFKFWQRTRPNEPYLRE